MKTNEIGKSGNINVAITESTSQEARLSQVLRVSSTQAQICRREGTFAQKGAHSWVWETNRVRGMVCLLLVLVLVKPSSEAGAQDQRYTNFVCNTRSKVNLGLLSSFDLRLIPIRLYH